MFGLLLGLAVAPTLSGCGAKAADRARTEALTRASRLGHPEVEYREIWSPSTAFGLGFVPFGASGLYLRDRWLALSGLLWPFSLGWLPSMAHDHAIELNDRDFELRMMEALEHPSAPTEEEP